LHRAADSHKKNAYGEYLRMIAERGVPDAI
jgi:hypothetical protein